MHLSFFTWQLANIVACNNCKCLTENPSGANWFESDRSVCGVAGMLWLYMLFLLYIVSHTRFIAKNKFSRRQSPPAVGNNFVVVSLLYYPFRPLICQLVSMFVQNLNKKFCPSGLIPFLWQKRYTNCGLISNYNF